MNSLVQFYRQNNPTDAASDEDIMDGFASRYQPEQLAQYPDFLADWQKLQSQRAVESSGIGEQFSRGFSRGVTGLETSAAGIGALASDTLGLPSGVKSYLLDVYKNKTQQMQDESPASVPTIQGAMAGPGAFSQYVAGKAGELLPAAGEALGFALAGTAVAPGPGTEAGLAAGIFGRAAARSAIGKLIEGTLSAAGKKQLEEYASGKVVESALEPAVAKVVKEAAGHIASVSASAANFAALGAGGAYGELSGREGVTPSDARTGAMIAGAGASVGALIPERLIKSLFGKEAAPEVVREWIDSKAVTVPKELLVAGSGMGAMEFFNILGEHYADPKLRDKPFSKEDWSRLLNATATGILAGGPTAAITALRGGPTKNWVPTPEEPTPPVEPGTPAVDPVVPRGTPPPQEPLPSETEYPGGEMPPAPGFGAAEAATAYPVTPKQRLDLRRIAEEVVAGKVSAEEEAAYLAANPGVRPVYTTIKQEVSDALGSGKIEGGIQSERVGNNEVVQKEAQNRNVPAGQQEEGAQTGASDKLSTTEGGIGQAAAQAFQALPFSVKETLRTAGMTPEAIQREIIARNIANWQKPTEEPTPKPKVTPTNKGLSPEEARANELAKGIIQLLNRGVSGSEIKDSIQRNQITPGEGPSPESLPPLELPEPLRKALRAAGVDPDTLTKGLTTAEEPHSTTPIDEARARARAMAFGQKQKEIIARNLANWKKPAEPPTTTPEAKTPEPAKGLSLEEQQANEMAKGIIQLINRGGVSPQELQDAIQKNQISVAERRGVPVSPEEPVKLPVTVQAALRRAGIDPDRLLSGGETAEHISKGLTHIDALIQQAKKDRAKASPETPKPAAERKVEPAAPVPEPAAPATVEAGAAPLRDTAWVASVPESYGAWVPAVEGKEKQAYSKDHGFESTASDKEKSNTKGIFQTPEGSIAVATLKKTRGVERVEQGPGKTAKPFDTLVDKGWKLLGYSRGITESKFFREHTAEEWAKIQPEIEAKAQAGRESVTVAEPVAPAEVAAAGLETTGGITSDVGKGALSRTEAEQIHDAVIKESKGIPADEESAKDALASALLGDKTSVNRIREIGGKNDTGLYLELFARYEAAVRKFHDSGSTDPEQFRSQVVSALAGLSAKESKAGTKAIEAPPGDLRKSEPTQPSRELSTDEQAAISAHLFQRLDNAGIPVKYVQTQAGPLIDSAAKVMGSYDRATKTITLHLSDLSRPNALDLRVSVEEIAHALFDSESKEMQDPILRAISKLDERNPGDLDAVKADIAHAYPGGIGPEVYQEELMAGWMTRKLQAEGFNPIQAQGIGRAILRVFKDLYLKAAMWMQQAFFGPKYANSDLALRYFQNRLEGFMAGDQETIGWVRTLGGPKPMPTSIVSWHEAVEGSENTREFYDSVQDRINYVPVVNDSIAAMQFNADQSIRYSNPAPHVGPTLSAGDFKDESNRLNVEAARLNFVKDVQVRAAIAANKDHAELVSDLGLTDTNRGIQITLAAANKVQAADFNPAQMPETFAHDANSSEAMKRGRADIVADQSKVQRRKASAEAAIKERTEKRDAAIKKHSDVLTTFPDADAMTRQMVKDISAEPPRIAREIETQSKRLGVVNQQLQALEGLQDRPIPREYSKVFQKLFTGTQLQGTRLFDLLSFMANDEGIDFSQPVTAIRNHMRAVLEAGAENHTYEMLTDTSREGKALLATVVAYGKQNGLMMALLEARKMPLGQERIDLINSLKDLRNLDTKDLAKGVRSLARTVATTERAKVAFRGALRDITRSNRDIKTAQARVATADAVLPVYANALDKISSKFELGAPFEAHTGAIMKIPPTETSSRAQWQDFTFSLSETTPGVKAITDPAALDEALTKQAAYLKAQDNLYRQGNEAAHGYDYQTIRRQFSEVFNSRYYEPYQQRTAHHKWELLLSPVSKQFDSFGTPASRSAGSRFRAYVADFNSMRQAALTGGNKIAARLNDALTEFNRNVPRNKKANVTWFKSEVLQPSLDFIEQQTDLAEKGLTQDQVTQQLYQRLGRYLLSDDRIRDAVGNNEARFMKSVKDLMELNYEEGQRYAGIVDRTTPGQGVATGVNLVGPGVEDPRMGGGIRRRVEAGLRTGQRKFSDYFKVLIHGLRESGWEMAKDEFKRIQDLWYHGDETAINDIEARYFHNPAHGDVVMDRFVRALAHAPGDSNFNAPLLADGITRPPASPEVVRAAFDASGGSIRKFAELMYDGHDGESPKGQYVQEVFNRLTEIYDHYNFGFKKTEGEGYESNSLKGIVQPVFLDARQFTNSPAQWFDYHIYDRRDSLLTIQKIATQKNFGRDGAKLEADVKAVEEEISAASTKFRDAKDQAQRLVMTGKKKDVEAEMARIVGGKDELKRLRNIVSNENIPSKARRQLNAFFKNQNQEDVSLAWPVQIAQTIAALDVNQLLTLITRFSTVLDGLLHFGLSPTSLKLTAQTLLGASKELTGSLLQGFYFDGWRNSVGEDEYLRLIGPDPLSSRRMKDIGIPLEGEQNFISRLTRKVRDVQEFGINPKGEAAQRTVLRPLAPVSMAFTAINKAGTIAMWNLAKKFLGAGMQHIELHPDATEITAKDLKLGALNGHSFEIFKKDINSYGLKYEEMARNALQRKKDGSGPILTDNEQARLCSLWDQEISIESSIATMPLRAFNDRLLRFAAPLLGWPYRRALQINDIAKDVRGQNSLKAFGYGLLGLGAVGIGGLGVTALQDLYSEELLGKKRNLRNLRLPTTGEDWIAINERLTRIGTLGFWGELLNSAVNVGTGQGDNRILSVDGRVVALGSMKGMLDTVSTLVHQNFDPDYVHVVRPFISSIGGNGLLQYMDLINHAGTFDNAESRFITRLSADNYLRVVGRDLGLSTKGGVPGAYSTPTPITPWIARMEMAAYGNDPADFREAYQGALAEAKRDGKDNPESYVKTSFETKHPLRYVFTPIPTEREYRQILSSLDSGGQESVTEAIRLFNYYGSHIGITPFAGSKKKPTAAAAAASRARAMAF